MSGTVAVIGAHERIHGFALAGVTVTPAADGEQARAAWRALDGDVTIVILTATAHAALTAEDLTQQRERLYVVMPG